MKPMSLALLFLVAAAASAQTIDQLIDREMPSLLATYKQLHAAPELSGARPLGYFP